MRRKELPIFRGDAKKLVEQSCARHGVTIALLQDLMNVQRDYLGSGRQMGISEEFESQISSYIDESGGEPS